MSNVGDLFADIPGLFEADGLHSSPTTPAPLPPSAHSAPATVVNNSSPPSPHATASSTPAATTNGTGTSAADTNGLLVFDISSSSTATMVVPTSEYLAMKNKINELTMENAKLSKEHKNMRKNVSSMKERVMATSTIRQKLDEYNNNLKQANQEKAQAVHEKTQLAMENAQLLQSNQQLHARVAETEKIKQELAAVKKEISKANSKTNAKQQEVTETKGMLMKTRAEQDNLKRTLASQQSEIERLKKELDAAQAQQHVQDQSQEDKIEELKSQLDDQSTEYEIERSAWEAKAEEAIENEKIAKQEAKLAKAENERLQRETTQARKENERLQREAMLAKTEADRAKQEMVRTKAEVEKLKEDLLEARKSAVAAVAGASLPPPPSPPVASPSPIVPPAPVAIVPTSQPSSSAGIISQIQDTLAMFAAAGEKLKLLNTLGTAGCLGGNIHGDSAAVITSLQERVADLEKEKAALQEYISLEVIRGATAPLNRRRRRSVAAVAAPPIEDVDTVLVDTDDSIMEPDNPTVTPLASGITLPSTSKATTTSATSSVVTTATTPAPATSPVLPRTPRAKATRKRKAREPDVDLNSVAIRNISKNPQANRLPSPAESTATPADVPSTPATISPAMASTPTLVSQKLGKAVPPPPPPPVGSVELVDQRASKRPRTSATVSSTPGTITNLGGLARINSSGSRKPADALARLTAIMEHPPPLSKMVKEVVRLIADKPELLTRAILKRAKSIRPIVSQFRQTLNPQALDLSQEERSIVALVQAIQAKRPWLYEQVVVGLSKSLIHDMEGVTVSRLDGTTVVARVTAAICRESGHISRMRAIIYDILREHPPASKLVFTLCENVASIWPLTFQLDDVQEGDDGGAQVMLQTFQAIVKHAFEKHSADIRLFGYSTFVDKCDWPKLEEVPTCKELAEYLMEVASTSVFRSRYASSTSVTSLTKQDQNGGDGDQQVLGDDFAFQLRKSLEVLLTQSYSAAEVQQLFLTPQQSTDSNNEKTPSTPPPSLYRMMLEDERYPLAIPLVTRVFGDRRFRKQQQQQSTTATANVAALCDLLGMILQSTATLPHQITAAMSLLELSIGNRERLRQLRDWYWITLESEADRKVVPETLRLILAKVGAKEAQTLMQTQAPLEIAGSNTVLTSPAEEAVVDMRVAENEAATDASNAKTATTTATTKQQVMEVADDSALQVEDTATTTHVPAASEPSQEQAVEA